MKLTSGMTSMKSNAVRMLAAATLAGAALTAAAPAAQAQRIVIGVGGPRYFAPAPPPVFFHGPVYGYGFDHRRYEDWRFHHDGFRRGWR